MGDFKQRGSSRFGGSHSGHGGGFKGRGNSGGRPSFRGPVTMHKVICDECKKPCEVPFLPTAGKPVYCSACFGSKREVGNNSGGDRFVKKGFDSYKTPPRTDFGNDVNKVSGSEIKKQIETLNVKIDKLIKVIEDMTANNTVALPKMETNILPVAKKVSVKDKKVVPTPKVKKTAKKVSKK